MSETVSKKNSFREKLNTQHVVAVGTVAILMVGGSYAVSTGLVQNKVQDTLRSFNPDCSIEYSSDTAPWFTPNEDGNQPSVAHLLGELSSREGSRFATETIIMTDAAGRLIRSGTVAAPTDVWPMVEQGETVSITDVAAATCLEFLGVPSA